MPADRPKSLTESRVIQLIKKIVKQYVASPTGGSTVDHGSLMGLGDDDHPQYVLRSILTTNGDLFIRAAGVIARLGIGADRQVLTAVSGAPVWSSAIKGANGATPGPASLEGGNGSGANDGAQAGILGGTSSSGDGGSALMQGGTSTTGSGGDVFVEGGGGGASGGTVNVSGGSSTSSGVGGPILIAGGTGVGTNQNGGQVSLAAGRPTGSGLSEVNITTQDNGGHSLARIKANRTGLGFFGATPIAKPTTTTVNAVVDAIEDYGLIDATGFSFQEDGRLLDVDVFTASGTWNIPTGCKKVIVECVGPGGGGGGVAAGNIATTIAGGGGAGGYARAYVSVSTNETVTVGTGGAGGAAGANAGASGSGPTSFGSHAVAGAGNGAVAGTTNALSAGGAGNIGTTGDYLSSGGSGHMGQKQVAQIQGGYGGNSVLGGGAGKTFGAGAGTNGTQGGGGSGAASNSASPLAGGNGGDGVVIVYSFS